MLDRSRHKANQPAKLVQRLELQSCGSDYTLCRMSCTLILLFTYVFQHDCFFFSFTVRENVFVYGSVCDCIFVTVYM